MGTNTSKFSPVVEDLTFPFVDSFHLVQDIAQCYVQAGKLVYNYVYNKEEHKEKNLFVILNSNNITGGIVNPGLNRKSSFHRRENAEPDLNFQDEYPATPRTADFNIHDQDSNLLDRCWDLARELTVTNPITAKLKVSNGEIDFHFEIENGKVTISLDDSETKEDDLSKTIPGILSRKMSFVSLPEHPVDIEERLFAARQELDDYEIDEKSDDEEGKEHKKRLYFGQDLSTEIFYEPQSEYSDSEVSVDETEEDKNTGNEIDEENIQLENEMQCEKGRINRLDFLKQKLMSTLQPEDKDNESGRIDGVLEICAKIEQEISTKKNSSQYSVNCVSEDGNEDNDQSGTDF